MLREVGACMRAERAPTAPAGDITDVLLALGELHERAPTLAAMLEAHDVRGLPMALVARTTGMTVHTAWGRRRRGLRALRRALARQQARGGRR